MKNKEEEKIYHIFLDVWEINIKRSINELIVYGNLHNIKLDIIKSNIKKIIDEYIKGF